MLSYQLKELETLDLREDEFSALESELKTLESASDVLTACGECLSILDDDDDLNSVIRNAYSVKSKLSNLNDPDGLYDIIDMVDTAIVNLEEAKTDISKYKDNFEVNPVREAEVKERVRDINVISDKMNVFPENICTLKIDVEDRIEKLNFSEDSVESSKEEMKKSYQEYILKAKELSKLRQEAAPKMCDKVNIEANKLNLAKDILKVVFSKSDAETSSGIDKIEFYIRPNLGQEYQPMKEIASGGEMSRIALSIQVASLQNDHIPTMIFDEVDTGLSGETGNVVGEMLRKVGGLGQVMCVTHLPQVAAQGHSHYFVSKRNVKRSGQEITVSSIKVLSDSERVQEVARMIGGDISSKESFDSAKLMLNISK